MPDWPNEEILTPHEVAALLRLTPQSIYNWVHAGKLPALLLGRRIKILRSDIDQLLAGGRSEGGDAVPNPGDPSGLAVGMLLYPLDPYQEAVATAEADRPWRTEIGGLIRFERVPTSPDAAADAIRELLAPAAPL